MKCLIEVMIHKNCFVLKAEKDKEVDGAVPILNYDKDYEDIDETTK